MESRSTRSRGASEAFHPRHDLRREGADHVIDALSFDAVGTDGDAADLGAEHACELARHLIGIPRRARWSARAHPARRLAASPARVSSLLAAILAEGIRHFDPEGVQVVPVRVLPR